MPAPVRYRQIAAELKTRIKKEGWDQDGVPSLRTLVNEYGVSMKTIQRAMDLLKHEGWIHTSPRRNITFTTRPSFRRLDRSLFLYVSSVPMDKLFRDQNSVAIHHGVEREIGKQRSHLLLAHDSCFERMMPDAYLDFPISGILLYGGFYEELLALYEKLNVPVVLLDQPSKTKQLNAVLVDNVEAACSATHRLMSLGHQRIAFLRQVNVNRKVTDPDSLERGKGFTLAHKQKGKGAQSAKAVFNSFTGDKPDSPTIQAILKTRPRFTAVMAVSPSRAHLIAKAARNTGLSIPRDLSIVCFQGTDPSEPSISGPRIDFEVLGQRGVQLLKEGAPNPQQVRVPAVWHEGKTVGKAKGTA